MGTSFAILETSLVGADGLLSADISHGVYQDGSTASVEVGSVSGVDIGDTLQVYAGYSGTDILFNGTISGIERMVSGIYRITGEDRFAKLKYPWSRDERSYSNDGFLHTETDNSVVQNLVEASGIDSGDTSIEGQDTPIGTVFPILLQNGDIALELIRKVDQFTVPNYVTFARADGAIYRRPIVIGSSSATYTSSSILDGSSRSLSRPGIVNSVKVVGRATFGVPNDALSQDTSAYIPDPPKYVTLNVTNDVIQDPTTAQNVADEILGRMNQPRDETTLRLKGDGGIHPATTITITHSRLDLSSSLRWVTTVRHSIGQDGFFTTLTAIKL